MLEDMTPRIFAIALALDAAVLLSTLAYLAFDPALLVPRILVGVSVVNVVVLFLLRRIMKAKGTTAPHSPQQP